MSQSVTSAHDTKQTEHSSQASHTPQANTSDIQTQLVEKTLDEQQQTNAKVQQALQGNSAQLNLDSTSGKKTVLNDQFSNVSELPVGTPQGQQATLPFQSSAQSSQSATNTHTVSSITANTLPRFNPKDDIHNPHTPDTDGLEETHFGFKKVKKAEKQAKVADVFTSVAKKYDIMNDLMSFGIHRLWKRYAISLSGVRTGQHVLDIAGGTGDLAKVFSREVGSSGKVVLSDINAAMLDVGRERLINAGCNNVDFVLANAETLAPFEDNSFDLLTISFGLRNVTDKDAALRAMYRVLKPGGRLLILEFSKPVFEPLSKAYDIYSFTALPLMGKLVANDAESYQYLAESIRMHPDQQTLKTMMEDAGFVNCDYHNLTAGIVAVHRGFKK
ncbi:bifunctional demethylmenaquinone methyltransferase/2-methoxy-6-polyprenyl-1,4-benzoquinol methylase UbiE [Psychrobacter lutiphocae]|uniref:bifunctional demethylmenaquinone methyltransferase/2-methoxy-6-polyprenyl-1,4-benzoquinol methylase UbiE n=1 Tax=Psychrobacter lutiphocae TaxID=540500 RepID=UPI000377B7C4|nr:bifunctional demethylmenaquinone methyltransferase/2-methoxy-6-polyprenyl-1,4-benzoquinol methylase UbiE [Psychrobacter lutiphocae]